jgi:hypothetical protein
MYKFIKNVLFVIYCYYNSGKYKDTAYFKTILVFNLILFLNILTILALLNINTFFDSNIPRWERYLYLGFGYVLPTYFIISKIFPEQEILKVQMENKKIRKYNICIISYFIMSIIFLTTAILIK